MRTDAAPAEAAFVVDQEIDGDLTLPESLTKRSLPGLLECQRLAVGDGERVILRTRWANRAAASGQLPVLCRALGLGALAARTEYHELQRRLPASRSRGLRTWIGTGVEWISKLGSALGALGIAYIWLYARCFAVPDVRLHAVDSPVNFVAGDQKVVYRVAAQNADKDAAVKLHVSMDEDPSLSSGLALDRDPRAEILVLGPGQTTEMAFSGRTNSRFGGSGVVTFTVDATGGFLRAQQRAVVAVPTRVWKPWDALLVEAAPQNHDCLLSYQLAFGVSSPSGWYGQLTMNDQGAQVVGIAPFQPNVSADGRLASFTVSETRPMATQRLWVRAATRTQGASLDCATVGRQIAITFDKKV